MHHLLQSVGVPELHLTNVLSYIKNNPESFQVTQRWVCLGAQNLPASFSRTSGSVFLPVSLGWWQQKLTQALQSVSVSISEPSLRPEGFPVFPWGLEKLRGPGCRSSVVLTAVQSSWLEISLHGGLLVLFHFLRSSLVCVSWQAVGVQ